MLPPSVAIHRACAAIRFGNNQNLMNILGGSWISTEYMDATELHNMWVSTNSPWPTNKDECDLWTLSTRIQLEAANTQYIYYFNAIEYGLSTPIYYLACALNWILNENFVNCDCTGEVGENGIINYIYQEQADWVANEEGPWKTAWLVKYEMSNMISMFGLVMALIAVSVVKRLDILIYI